MDYLKRKPITRTLYINGKTLILDGSSKIMGIINLTPDSFSDGGEWSLPEKALEQGIAMEIAGAHIIDIGGESSRPGHSLISIEEEISRINQPLKLLSKNLSIPISVDTWKSEVAEFALKNGANVINDIYGLKKDPKLAKMIAEYHAGVIIMHNNESQDYPNGLIPEIIASLTKSIDIALKSGINENNIIIDPGIGFAKSPKQNIELLGKLSELQDLGFPILLGVSRKSVIGSVVNVPPKDRLPGTIASTVLGILQGCEIFRVHDVSENLQAAVFTEKIVNKE